jgi:hypothetical protein
VAGTATAVSNRVSRRQANRWAQDDQAAVAQPAPPPTAPASSGADEMLERLRQLGELKEKGILTDEEFAAQKARILAT